MPIGTAAATIIGAVIAAGTSTGVGIFNAKRAREANEEALRLANIARQDKLKVDEANEKMNRWQRRFSEKQFSFQKEEAKKARAERSEEKGYQRRNKFMSDSLNIVNQNPALRQTFFATMRRAT